MKLSKSSPETKWKAFQHKTNMFANAQGRGWGSSKLWPEVENFCLLEENVNPCPLLGQSVSRILAKMEQTFFQKVRGVFALTRVLVSSSHLRLRREQLQRWVQGRQCRRCQDSYGVGTRYRSVHDQGHESLPQSGLHQSLVWYNVLTAMSVFVRDKNNSVITLLDSMECNWCGSVHVLLWRVHTAQLRVFHYLLPEQCPAFMPVIKHFVSPEWLQSSISRTSFLQTTSKIEHHCKKWFQLLYETPFILICNKCFNKCGNKHHVLQTRTKSTASHRTSTGNEFGLFSSFQGAKRKIFDCRSGPKFLRTNQFNWSWCQNKFQRPL